MQDPPRMTLIVGLAPLNSATLIASSYVAPPTMKITISIGLLPVLLAKAEG